MANDIYGTSCKDCTAHPVLANAVLGYKNVHGRIDAMEKSKLSIRLFITMVTAILIAMVMVSGFLWNGTKEVAAASKEFHDKVGDKMTEMSISLKVIEKDIENR